MLLSGITCIRAFALLAAGSGLAEPLSLASGVLTVPFAIAAAIYARQIRHAGDRCAEDQDMAR